MAMDEDLDVFFDTDDFAVTATLNGSAAGSLIFDRDYLRALGIVSSSNPLALAQAADYDETAIDGTLVCSEGTFVIRERQLQDDGKLVLLQLEDQA